ncbi:MAG: HlyC/CorC family transporter [Candidatus Competibacterales bacterium]
MKEDPTDPGPGQRSWLERLSLALTGEPNNRRELVELLRDAQSRNLLDQGALKMMEGVMAVSEMRVRDVMIPRSQMQFVERQWPLEQLLSRVIASGHSRFPVIGEDRDDVVGILIAKDLLKLFAAGGGDLNLQDLLRPAKFIPESKRLDALLEEFRIHRLHMAMVVDEYGGVSGLVTIEDVLEQIVGEIDDEHDDAAEIFIRPEGQGSFTIKALTPIEEFNGYFGARFDDDKADTVGGLLIMALGRLPKRGEEIQLDRFRFRVLRADNRRLHLLGLRLTEVEANGASPLSTPTNYSN